MQDCAQRGGLRLRIMINSKRFVSGECYAQVLYVECIMKFNELPKLGCQ